MSYKSIAIDGPSGAGKSTLAKMLAQALDFLYVDTGAIYRTVALRAIGAGVNTKDAEKVTALLANLEISMAYGDDGLQHMFLNGTDVTDDIRLHAVSAGASDVSAIPAVRKFLLEMQRDMARKSNVVMDGRDIGTVVLPDADVKIFLTARLDDRANRRYLELLERGQSADCTQVHHDLAARDEQDSNRAAAPLRQGDDAFLVDTTGNTLEESYAVLIKLVKEKLGA